MLSGLLWLRPADTGEGTPLILLAQGPMEMVLTQYWPRAFEECGAPKAPFRPPESADQRRQGIGLPLPTGHRYQQGGEVGRRGWKPHGLEQGGKAVRMRTLALGQQHPAIGTHVGTSGPPGQGTGSRHASVGQQQGFGAGGAKSPHQPRNRQRLPAQGARLADEPLQGDGRHRMTARAGGRTP
jgi:hypothetical protein